MSDNSGHYSRGAPANRSLRASDHDRAAVGEVLRREHVAGRLDSDEFADRFGRCLEAKTYAELDELISDLPEEDERAFAAAGPGPMHDPGGRGRGVGWRDAGWTGAGWGRGVDWSERPCCGPSWWPGVRRWRVALFAWLALAIAVAAFTGGHVFWLGFPLLFFFVVRSRACRSPWRYPRRGPGWGHGGPWVT
ncbi:MAG: DUF1707 SHOCT-like domain-containing protein [Acidimicrobiales bacterium]